MMLFAYGSNAIIDRITLSYVVFRSYNIIEIGSIRQTTLLSLFNVSGHVFFLESCISAVKSDVRCRSVRGAYHSFHHSEESLAVSLGQEHKYKIQIVQIQRTNCGNTRVISCEIFRVETPVDVSLVEVVWRLPSYFAGFPVVQHAGWAAGSLSLSPRFPLPPPNLQGGGGLAVLVSVLGLCHLS